MGTSRNRSAVVRASCWRSRLQGTHGSSRAVTSCYFIAHYLRQNAARCVHTALLHRRYLLSSFPRAALIASLDEILISNHNSFVPTCMRGRRNGKLMIHAIH